MKRIAITAALVLAYALFGMPAEAAARTAETELRLEIHKGAVLRLDRPAASVFVADPAIAEVSIKSPRMIYIVAKRPGATTVFAVGADDRVILRRKVNAIHNLSQLNQAINELLPAAAIEARSVDGGLLLAGAVGDASQAADAQQIAERFLGEKEVVVNRLRVTAPTQVNLRVRIAEMSREVVKRFGFNWDIVQNGGSFLFGLASGNLTQIGGAFLTRQNDVFNAFGRVTRGNLDFNVLVDALSREGMITLLAEPNLTASSGETASFLAGGEFPIPVPQDDNSVTIEFKKFGVSLAFTPTVLSGNRISLRVRPEVSQLTSTGSITLGGFVIPALTTRRAETSVELASGQSFAIAGLLQQGTTEDIRKYPGLGDLPVIGALFRNTEYNKDETELVIMVTPYLVRPVATTAMATPLDGYRPATDRQRVLEGKIQQPRPRTRGPRRELRGAALVGPAGYQLN